MSSGLLTVNVTKHVTVNDTVDVTVNVTRLYQLYVTYF
jgi:hypothetical protein